MSGIEFDREAIGVNAKKDWADASYFGACRRDPWVRIRCILNRSPVLPLE